MAIQHKFKVGDTVNLESKSSPHLNGLHVVSELKDPSGNDLVGRTGEKPFEPLYRLKDTGDDLWLERCLSRAQ